MQKALKLAPFGTEMIFRIVQFFLGLILLFSASAHAGKHAYPELIDYIAPKITDIMIEHGMAVRHDRDDPWLATSAIPEKYTLIFSRAEEIPQQVVLDVIRFYMDLYDERGHKDCFRILMYRETQDERRGFFSRAKPFFELTLGRDD